MPQVSSSRVETYLQKRYPLSSTNYKSAIIKNDTALNETTTWTRCNSWTFNNSIGLCNNKPATTCGFTSGKKLDLSQLVGHVNNCPSIKGNTTCIAYKTVCTLKPNQKPIKCGKLLVPVLCDLDAKSPSPTKNSKS
ncbi:hypothetical protein O181_087119 [Austropuccinia psidii MF-1]|uniref:Uncharacterized protein n=1 Tax=Austropuccinia psidii MF-1 TaxID=1389203 RepID=A0A9Q3IP52_9BASI|nr:hypothetical protein [Austropuccinia psidii MF-1]